MVVPPAPVCVPSQRPLAPSVVSVTSITNDKGDNEMITELCTDLLAFGEENVMLNPLFCKFLTTDQIPGRPRVPSTSA